MLPLIFEPYLRPQIWGGRELERLFNKKLPLAGTFGESWEVSAHPHHVSVVAEGPWIGQRLTDLVAERAREVMGDSVPGAEPFPLLVKLLDCQELLSIQVHPDDATASTLLPGERGKTEAWVVLAVGPNGRVYAGLKPGIGREEVERAVAEGTLERCLHGFRPNVGDVIFLPAGTVHAVGGGVVIAETQQSSDATFRLYDWNRVGPDGKPRALHIGESLASIRYDAGPMRPCSATPINDIAPPHRGETLVRCPHFALDRYVAAGKLEPRVLGRLSIWMVLAGKAELACGAWRRPFAAGETTLIPASATAIAWQTAANASATLMCVTLPDRPTSV